MVNHAVGPVGKLTALLQLLEFIPAKDDEAARFEVLQGRFDKGFTEGTGAASNQETLVFPIHGQYS